MQKIVDSKELWNKAFQNEALKVPFLTYSWHRIWFETIGKQYRPLTLISKSGCIIPLAQNNTEVLFSGGDEIADYLDMVGTANNKEHAWRETLIFLKKNAVTKISLHNIPQNSETAVFFQKNFPLSISTEDTTPIIELPTSWDEYLVRLNRKHRHELRRKMRKFETLHPLTEVKFNLNPKEDTDELFRLMQLNPQKKTFLSSAMEIFFRKIMHEFKESAYIPKLVVDQEIVAILLGFRLKDSLLLYNSGFDEKKYSGASLYLIAKSIEDAVRKGLKKYNFLQGGERYKYELGAKDFNVYNVELTL